MGTEKLKMAFKNGKWTVNGKPYKTESLINGFYTYMIQKFTLVFEREETDEFGNIYKCEVRLFTNGRFVLKNIKNGEEVSKAKRYVSVPVVGMLGLVTKEAPGESYAWWRPMDLQDKMDELNLTNVKSKPENSFIIDGRHWRIRERRLSEPKVDDKINVTVKTNGTMHVTVPSDGYIYIDFDDKMPIDQRYAMIHRRGTGDKFVGMLYVDRGLFNDSIYNDIKTNPDTIKLK